MELNMNWQDDEFSSDLSSSDEYVDEQEFVLVPLMLLPDRLAGSSESESVCESIESDIDTEDIIWNSFHIRAKCIALYSKLNEYYASGEYTDVNIICQDRVFKCHRLALAAASEYFHVMFSGSFREREDKDVVLKDIDSTTFEQILHCVYTGNVGVVNDENVYNLLRASDALTLPTIENRCICYLNQRKIPIDDALDIFSLAYVTGKEALIPVVSRFILQRLNHFWTDLMGLSFAELGTMLRYFDGNPSSESKEKALVKMIRERVIRENGTRENFVELARNVEFKHISSEYIEEYFDKNTNNCAGEMNSTDTLSLADSESQLDNSEPSLTVYINGFDPVLGKYESYLSKLEEYEIQPIWSPCRVIKTDGIDQMRTVVLDERLYCLKSYRSQLTFNATSSTDLSSNLRSLNPPPNSKHYSGYPYFVCHDNDSIYFLRWDHKIFAYNCHINSWSYVPSVMNQQFFPTMMTSYDRQLYLIGSKPYQHPHRYRGTSTSNVLRVYDHRIGKLEKLASCKNPHSQFNDECCSYNGRIYATHGEKRRTFMVDVYDPKAGKWDVILRKAKKTHNLSFRHRLLPFDDRMWMFYSESNTTICCETFDSFLEDWGAEISLNPVFENRKCPRIVDAVVF